MSCVKLTTSQQIFLSDLKYYGRIIWDHSGGFYGFDNGGGKIHKTTVDSLIKRGRIKPLNDSEFGAKSQTYVAN